MPKWKKDAKEFTVSVNYNEARGYQSSIPKPIMEALGQPESITFLVSGDNVKILGDSGKEKNNKSKKTI